MDRVEDCISFVVGKAAQRVSRRARDLLVPHGVTPAQYAVLKSICDSRCKTASELIQRLMIDTATLTGIVDRLEAADFVIRQDHPRDRRVHVLNPTRKARRQIGSMDQAMDTLNAEMRKLMGPEANAVWKGLRKLNPGTNSV